MNLGNTKAPESSVSFGANVSPVVLDAGETTSLGSITLYSGIGTGTYYFGISDDGIQWTEVDRFDQDYVALLKWHTVTSSEFFGYNGQSFRYLAVSYSGTPELCELIVRDADGSVVPLSGCSVLTDEADLEPEHSTFMDSSYFDEIYHARTALEHLRGIWPYEISHPPLGKTLLGLGIRLFGVNPFGWRFIGTLTGVLMLPVMYWFARKMFRSSFAGMCCCILMASDFMHFNQTRIATIDVYAVFFILLMYLFMYLFITEEKKRYLALSGLFFGIGCACKWTCIYAGGGLAVIWAGYWIFSGRVKGLKAFLRNCLFCLVFFVLIPLVIYYVSYAPYGKAVGLSGPGMFFTGEYAKIVWDNQTFMFNYHSGVTATHPYSSRWYQWMLDIRPILYYLDYPEYGMRSSFGAFVNPVVAWAGLVSLLFLIPMALLRREKRAAFLLVGYLAQLVPWMFVTRITFEYHYFPCTVFLILALGYMIDLIERYSHYGKAVAGGLTGFSAVLYLFFYPILAGLPIPSALVSQLYGWLQTWPF